MLENKLFINLYVLALDQNYELFIPVNERVGNIVNLINTSLMCNCSGVLISLYSGQVYNNNDVVRNTDIKNGTKLILV